VRRHRALLAAGAAGLVVAGCAVLTVDVDVYKGALSNHERVQTEQVAAMAMGAKPLLAELRTQLERRACLGRLQALEERRGAFTRAAVDEEHADLQKECPAYFRMRNSSRFVADVDALSRQTTRVNAILSLYDEAPKGEGGEVVRFLQDRLRDLGERIERGRPLVGAYLGGNASAQRERATVLVQEALRPDRDPGHCRKSPADCPHGLTDAEVTAVQAAWAAAREAWREAMRILSSEATRSRLEKDAVALDAVAWIAASLTSLDGLNLAVTRATIPVEAVEKARPKAEDSRLRAETAQRKLDQARSAVVAARTDLDHARQDRDEAAAEHAKAQDLARRLEANARAAAATAANEGAAAESARSRVREILERLSTSGAAAPGPGGAGTAREAADAARRATDATEVAARAAERAAASQRLAEEAAANLRAWQGRLESALQRVAGASQREARAVADLDEVEAAATTAAQQAALDAAEQATAERAVLKAQARQLPPAVSVDKGAFAELVRRVPILRQRGPLRAPDDGRQESPDERRQREKEAARARGAARGALSELLQDSDIGRSLATQLLVAQAHAESPDVRGGYVALHPTEAIFLRQDDSVFGNQENFQYLMQVSQRIRDNGLGRGRPEEGLETLIEAYLKSRNPGSTRREVANSRDRLLNALINFGEKVTIIANLDILVQDADAGGTAKYTRLLQAVGNSIISQVDALRQLQAHQLRAEDGRDVELHGLRNAEKRAGPALTAVRDDLTATDDFSGRQGILDALRSNQSSLVTLVTAIRGPLQAQRATLLAARNASAHWAAATSVLGSAEMQAAVATHAAAAGNLSMADVVQHVAGLLRARLPAGGEAEARRLQRAATILTGEFTGPAHTTNPGNANDKYVELTREAGRRHQRAMDTETSAGRIVAALERAQAVTGQLAGGDPLAGMPPRLEQGRKDASAKDVIDVMLATLRHEHVEAVRQGRDSEMAKNHLAAVELLYAYRSGLIHIRPAATFLRNSYPASVLQSDPTAGVWRNMLTDHGKRQLPFYDFFLGLEEEAKINKTIDKQFWQRVNQVRVAGAGRTNYAIAKDDVGNWYVKDYGSNPTDIIRSAQSLAMFAAGPAMGANLLARPGARQTLGAAAGNVTGTPALPPRPGDAGEGGAVTAAAPAAQPVAAEAPRSTLQRQLDRHARKYADATRKARVDLKPAIEGLWDSGSLQAAVRDAVTADEMAIIARQTASVFDGPQSTAAFAALASDNEGREPKTAAASNRDIAEALRAVKQHRLQILARIDRLPVAAEGETFDPTKHVRPEARGLARAAVDTVIRDLLEKVLREREAATRAYEQAILFIGETAGL
jgi:hypothetical protein